MLIRKAKKEDIFGIKTLWDICFPEDSVFNTWFFKNVYKNENMLVYCINDKVCSMLQMFPYKLKMNGIIYPIHYIFGVGTHPFYRNNGLMEKLLLYACEEGISRGDVASILIPQEKWLFSIYEKYGYQPDFYVREMNVYVQESEQKLLIDVANEEDIDLISELYIEKTKHNKGTIIRNEAYWKQQIVMFKETGGNVYCLKKENKCLAYGFVNYIGDKLFIQEGFGITDEYLSLLAQQILLKEMKNSALLFTSFDDNDDRRPIGCIKFLQDNCHEQLSSYLNLMFN